MERITNKKLYRLPDAIANISCGTTSELSGLFLKILAVGIYQFLFENYAFFTLDNKTWWYWLTLFLLVDFAYYWGHRFSHEVNLFWGGHVVHHQSEEYNLSVAVDVVHASEYLVVQAVQAYCDPLQPGVLQCARLALQQRTIGGECDVGRVTFDRAQGGEFADQDFQVLAQQWLTAGDAS